MLYNLVMKLWSLSGMVFRLGKVPVVGAFLYPLFSQRHNQVVILPVNEQISQPHSTVLPYELLRSLVENSSQRFVLDNCMCRANEDCGQYPHTIGCLFLGDGASQIDPALGHALSVEQALFHIRRGMQTGLIPLVAHTVFDAFILGISHRRMLTICLCCDCCCVVRKGLRMGPPAFWQVVRRLPGLTVEVGDDCLACQTCFSACPVGAISMNTHRAQISEYCKGCGRCVEACPQGAISMHLDGQPVQPRLAEFWDKYVRISDQ